MLPADQQEKIQEYELKIKNMKKEWTSHLDSVKAQQTEFGYNLLANISLLAQIALSMVETYPDASDLSLQISNIIDELGIFAQWLIGKEKSNELW